MRKLVPPEIAQLSNGMMQVVPVIASFDSAGTVMPLYVRIRDVKYQVLRCWLQDYGPLWVYHCTVSHDNKRQQELCLTYHPREVCWTIKVGGIE